ncbi:MAG: site-specific integrase [Methanobrevibacter sp.]|nr:site-specific integrase [Methanobrevibacter sp.]
MPSWQDVKKAVDNTENLKYKALILFLATTGLRVSDVVNLTIKDLLKATKQYHNGTIENLLEQDPNNIIPVWDFDPQKTKDEGNLCITFNTPETTEYLFNYLKNRISKGYNTNNDSPLFNSTQTTKKYNSKSVTTIFKQVINPLVGNRLDTQNRAFFRPHNLRKLFKTTCSNNIGRVSIEVEEELPFTKQYDIVSILAGHKPHNSQITEIYEAIDSEDIKPYYFHLIPYLSINKVKIKDIKSDEYIKLENKLKDKDTQLDNLTARFNDFEKERNKIMTQIKKLKENER